MAGGSSLGGAHVVMVGEVLLVAVLVFVVVLVVAVLLVVVLKLDEESLLYPLLE